MMWAEKDLKKEVATQMKEKTISTISEKDAEPLDEGCGR